MDEIKEAIAVKTFNILMENELDTDLLHDYAKKVGVPVSYVLFLFNKWIRRTEAPCPTKEQLDKYNEMVIKKNSKVKEKRAKYMFDKYLESGFSRLTLEKLSSDFNISIVNILSWITKYVNGEFQSMGLMPSDEDVLKYNDFYASVALNAKKERETKKAIIAKDCFDEYLTSNFSVSVLESLCAKYNVSKPTVLNWIRNYSKQIYLDYGFSPSFEDQNKYDKLMNQRSQNFSDVKNEKFRSNRAPLACDAFNIYLSSELSLDVIPMLAAKHNVTENVIKSEIRKYKNGEYADYGYAPSEEEKQRYEYLFSNRKPRKNLAYEKTRIQISAEAYEILLANNLDKNALKPLANKLGISIYALLQRIDRYRKRILEPRPTIEQEFKYIALVRKMDDSIIEQLFNQDNLEFSKFIKKEGEKNIISYLDKLEQIGNARVLSEIVKLREKVNSCRVDKFLDNTDLKTYNLTARKCADAMIEYIESPLYSTLSVFKKYFGLNCSIESLIKLNSSKDEKVASLCPIFEQVKKEKIEKFQNLLLKINQNMIEKRNLKRKYDIVDLCLDIDTNMDDFAIMIRYLRTINGFNIGAILTILDNMIISSKINTLKSATSDEQIAKLKYNYNGIELTTELKENIISFLNKHNIRVMAYTIILTFEKYVRGELSIMPEFQL